MVIVACLGGCTANLKKQNSLLNKENEELRAQISERNSALGETQASLREKEQELARLKREGGAPAVAGTGFEQIPNIKATAGIGEVTVAVESDVLFASGKTTLKDGAKKSLDQVAEVLNRSYKGQQIRIEGYTDTDPIKKSGYKSNYHLGFERAWAVREYLVSKGVDSKQVSLASYGPNDPANTKAASRRVEIVVCR
jgi:outer membrane protein OmpA-like peptidoglycan-associated protein